MNEVEAACQEHQELVALLGYEEASIWRMTAGSIGVNIAVVTILASTNSWSSGGAANAIPAMMALLNVMGALHVTRGRVYWRTILGRALQIEAHLKSKGVKLATFGNVHARIQADGTMLHHKATGGVVERRLRPWERIHNLKFHWLMAAASPLWLASYLI